MKKTRICEILGIEYPIIQGAMGLIAGAELAAAVSEAGGLGVISPNAGEPEWSKVGDNMRNQIRKARSLTAKPFGMNFPIHMIKDDRTLIDIAIEEGVSVVTTGAGSPALHTPYFHEHGIKVLHLVATVKHAAGAEKAGVDAVIAEGYESGGINSPDELTTLVLIPQVVDAVKIPVVAAGGIGDGRGLAAALALGAEGVQMGTRFVATAECLAHPDYKKAIVDAADNSTVITGRGLMMFRGLLNELTRDLVQKERSGAPDEERSVKMFSKLSESALLGGDVVSGQAACGAVAGLVRGIESAGDVVRRMVEEYDRIVATL
ncbi:MAG: nitronate monooxygenase [Chloroflexota bacterium]|nr:nitronate monooxygenase [Chloroflexota bacterium]